MRTLSEILDKESSLTPEERTIPTNIDGNNYDIAYINKMNAKLMINLTRENPHFFSTSRLDQDIQSLPKLSTMITILKSLPTDWQEYMHNRGKDKHLVRY